MLSTGKWDTTKLLSHKKVK